MSIYWQAPASKYSSIMTWRRTHTVFKLLPFHLLSLAPTMSRGNQFWWFIGLLKVPNTSMCGQLGHCPGAAATWILHFRLNRPGNKAGTFRNGRTTHIGQFGAWNLDCCSSLKDLLSLCWLQRGPVTLSGYCIYLGKAAWIPKHILALQAQISLKVKAYIWVFSSEHRSPRQLQKSLVSYQGYKCSISPHHSQKMPAGLKRWRGHKGQPWNVLRHEDIGSKIIWWEFPHYRKHS